MPYTVGDYTKQRKIAEALRTREKALESGVAHVNSAPIVTQGTGRNPARVDVNYGSAIEKLGLAFMARNAQKDATTAEDTEQQARQDALNTLTGQISTQAKTPGSPSMTPEQLDTMKQLGYSAQDMKAITPETMSTGAFLQAMANPHMRKALVKIGAITQADDDSYTAQETKDAAKALSDKESYYQFTQDHKRMAPPKPVQPKGMTNAEQERWMYEHDRPNWELRYATKGGAGGKGQPKLTPQQIAMRTQGVVGQLDTLTQRPSSAEGGAIDEWTNQIGTTLQNYDDPSMKSLGSKMMNATGIEARNLQLDAVINEIQKLVPASNTDFANLMNRYNSAILNPAEFHKFAQEFATQYKLNFDSKGEYVGKDADKSAWNPKYRPTATPDDVDELVNKYADKPTGP